MKKILRAISIIFVLEMFLLGLSNQTQAAVLFKDNFDNHPDWHNSCERINCGCREDACIDNELPNWDFWNMDEMWNPDTDSDSSRPQISISSENARSGKCVTMSPENHKGRSGDGWGSDGIVATHFTDTKEVWVEMWMKRQIGFTWNDEGERGSATKTIRIESDHGDRPFSFSHSSTTVPLYIFKYGHKELYDSLDRHDHTIRCSELDPDYYCSGDYNDLARGMGYPINTGDGNYHKYTWHLKMNSGLGNGDGVIEHFIDDQLVRSQYNISWTRSDNGLDKNFNFLGIGGNNYNGLFTNPPPDKIEDATGDEGESWYAIDDICVSTVQSDLASCFSPIVIRADVDQNFSINSTDALLTLRNSLGLNMSSTNWQASSTTGDVNCNSNSNSTDALLILRESLGLDMSGTGWCIS